MIVLHKLVYSKGRPLSWDYEYNLGKTIYISEKPWELSAMQSSAMITSGRDRVVTTSRFVRLCVATGASLRPQ